MRSGDTLGGNRKLRSADEAACAGEMRLPALESIASDRGRLVLRLGAMQKLQQTL